MPNPVEIVAGYHVYVVALAFAASRARALGRSEARAFLYHVSQQEWEL